MSGALGCLFWLGAIVAAIVVICLILLALTFIVGPLLLVVFAVLGGLVLAVIYPFNPPLARKLWAAADPKKRKKR